MLAAVEEMIHSAPASIVRARSTLVNALYLKGVRHHLKSDPDVIIGKLLEMRDALFQFSNFRVVVVANVKNITKPVSSWESFTVDLDISKPLNPLEKPLSRLSDAGRNPGKLAYIIPMPTIDSSFALSVAKGPSSLKDPRIPALMVALSFLDAVEGPMWVAVRGIGLAYGTRFARYTDSGQISYSVFRSPNAFKAFQTSRSVVEGFVRGDTDFDPLALEGAISSIVLNFANSQATMASAAQMSFVRQVIRELPEDWNERMLEKVRAVTAEEIRAVMKNLVLPVLTAATANLVVTCAPVMEEELVKGFEKMGFTPEVRSLASFQDSYGMDIPEGEETEDEDDEIDGEDEGGQEEDDEESEEDAS